MTFIQKEALERNVAVVREWCVQKDNRTNVEKGQKSLLYELYLTLKSYLQDVEEIPLDRLDAVQDDVLRINQIETILDVFSQKIMAVKHDPSIDEEERDFQLDYWVRDREQHIQDVESGLEGEEND